jgi:Fe-S cluster assembly iron-binding protein IscA
MALEESVHEDDKVIDEDGIKIAFTESVSRFLPGMKVDFIPGRFGGLILKPGGGGHC